MNDGWMWRSDGEWMQRMNEKCINRKKNSIVHESERRRRDVWYMHILPWLGSTRKMMALFSGRVRYFSSVDRFWRSLLQRCCLLMFFCLMFSDRSYTRWPMFDNWRLVFYPRWWLFAISKVLLHRYGQTCWGGTVYLFFKFNYRHSVSLWKADKWAAATLQFYV